MTLSKTLLMRYSKVILILTFFLHHILLISSDHIDGPVTIAHPVADITDLFVFPSPDHPGHITLILDVYTGVAANGHFSDKVTYDFIIKYASIRKEGLVAGFDVIGDYKVSCTFETPHGLFASHWITCKSSTGLTVRTQVDKLQEEDTEDGIRVFAGRRSDPFFFNAGWALDASTKGEIPPPKDNNIMQDVNTLSIVLVIDIEKELGLDKGSLFAVAGRTSTQDANGTRQIDRIGRPEITNVTMVTHDGIDLRDQYNAQKPFDLSGPNIELFRQRFRDNVMYFDSLNHSREWTTESGNNLAEILLNDYQVVDVSKEFTSNTYFEIEKAILRGEPHTTCGGRTPNEDIMDVVFTMLINGGNLPLIRDGVDRPTKLASEIFPYLAAPNEGFNAIAKSFVVRAIAKLTGSGKSPILGVLQLMSGVTMLAGILLLIYLGIRKSLTMLRRGQHSFSKQSHLILTIGLLFAVASILGILTNAYSFIYTGLLSIICVVTIYLYFKSKNYTIIETGSSG